MAVLIPPALAHRSPPAVSASLPRRAFTSSQGSDSADTNSRNGSPQQQAVSASVEPESPASVGVNSAPSSSSALPTPAVSASSPAAATAYPRRRASHPAPLDNSWGQATTASLSSGTKFALTKNFIDKWRHKTPPFGYNGLGELVYRRTYSRKLHEQPDGSPQGANEQWFEVRATVDEGTDVTPLARARVASPALAARHTHPHCVLAVFLSLFQTVERVVNGTYNMQKQWIEQHELGWNAWKAQKSAQEMFERIFTMKFLPPGRGLWAMGSPITETRRLYAALNNCLTMDTQVMTDSGFMFHDEIVARLAAGQPVEAACYDATRQQLCYRPIGASDIIYKEIDTAAHGGDPQHQIVDLVHSEQAAAEAGEKGFGRGMHAELSVTADHDVFVQFATDGNREQQPFRKMQARELFEGKHQAASREVHVLTHAANGAEQAEQAEPACFQRLGLVTEEEKMAFLELYGYWVADGSLDLQRRAISFTPTKMEDVTYLHSLFARLPLRLMPTDGQREGYLVDDEVKEQTRFSIFEAAWVDCFIAESALQSPEPPAAEGIQSDKSLWSWVFKRLNKEQLRAVVRGLRSADGNEGDAQKSGGHITTSSVRLRDELQRLLLHAGYASSFALACTKDDKLVGQLDRWRVDYTDAEQSTTTSFKCTAEVTKRASYQGGVWCIRVPTADRLIMVRKAERNTAGVVTEASRPCIVGNCAFVSTEGIDSDQDKSKPFTFLMDASMLGVGVGFDTKGAGKLAIKGAQNVHAPRTFVIPDSREGWVEALRLLINSYILGREAVAFDYSLIRPFGTPIRGFGGVASGPSALMELLESVRKLMEARVGSHLTATDITDIMNLIGRCVVAGNVRRCLPGDALVHTRDGLIPIRHVQRGQEVLTFTGQFRRVVDHVVQGEQGLVKIVTAHSEFRCTPTHRMAVLQGKDGAYVWKRADQLAKGDNLISPRTPIPGAVTRLPAWSNPCPPPPSVPGAPIEVPELDASMAWLMGLFQSNGRADLDSAHDGENAHVQLLCADAAVAAKAASQLQRFGADLIVDTQAHGSVRCQSKQLAAYFHEHVAQATSLRVPGWIASSTLANRQAFVAGVLDSRRASAPEDQSASVLSTTDAEYALEVQRLLYSCGVESRADLCRDAESPRASSLVLFTEHAAQLVSAFPELVQPRTWKLDSLSLGAQAGGAHFLPVPVVRVEASGREDTFDISVEGEHEFFVNGLLSHNTAEIAFGDPDSDEYLDLKNYEKNPSRAEFGWTSNNSVFARLGMDYNKVCDRVRANGEPGFAWLENMQQYGRMNGVRDDRDHRVKGGNPCLEQSLESYECQ